MTLTTDLYKRVPMGLAYTRDEREREREREKQNNNM